MIDLRPATTDDAQALLGIYGPYVVTNAVSFESMPPSAKEMRARITEAADIHPWIVAFDDESGLVLGYAFAKPTQPAPATGSRSRPPVMWQESWRDRASAAPSIAH